MDKTYGAKLCITGVLLVLIGCAAGVDYSEQQTSASQMTTPKASYGSGSVSGGGAITQKGLGPNTAQMSERMTRVRGQGFGPPVGGSMIGSVERRTPLAKSSSKSTPIDKKVGINKDTQLLEQGKYFYKRKKYYESVTKLKEFLKNFEYHDLAPEAWLYLGESYLRKEQYGEALRAYKKIYFRYLPYPGAPLALFRMAQCYEKIGNKKAAADSGEKLETQFPKFNLNQFPEFQD